MAKKVITVILGGGRGTRLYPLTRDRAKPAVPFGGKYRLVDIPISNAINSDLTRIYLLTQFQTASLHRHIYQSYNFDHFHDGFIEILAAEQTLETDSWYQGTADAVRHNLRRFSAPYIDYVMILSGDQLYRMDFRELIRQHEETEAEVTIATIPVAARDASKYGIMKVDENREIVDFVEKPQTVSQLRNLAFCGPLSENVQNPDAGNCYLASMGIYLFRKEILRALLNNDHTDFGNHIIPDAIRRHRVFAYLFQGYWEDIGTIRAFYEANLNLTHKDPPFDFYNRDMPVYSHPRYLPASRFDDCTIEQSLIADGCQLDNCRIENALIGVRSLIGAESSVKDTIIMGNDYFESAKEKQRNLTLGIPNLGIGLHCYIERAIIDKNPRIGNSVIIWSKEGEPDADFEHYCIRDGLVIIPKGAILKDNTEI